MHRLRYIAALLILSVCSTSPPAEPSADVLRVSIYSAVAPVGVDNSGPVAFLAELVYRHASEYFSDATVVDGKLILKPKGPSPSLDVLASAMLVPQAGPFVVAGSSIEAPLRTGTVAPPLDEMFVDMGPFKQESITADKLTLRRRSGEGIGTIEVIGTSGEEEEWRRLLARSVDLVPSATPSHLRYLEEVPSVRIVPFAENPTSGLLFNVSAPALRDVRVRRAISLALRRAAIAEVAAGDASAAVRVPEDSEQARRLLQETGAPRLRVILYSALSDDQRAAMVVEQQLEEVGFSLQTRVVSLDESLAILNQTRDFDIAFIFAGFEPKYFRRALSGNRGNMTGYSNPDFDAAVAASDTARAIEILQRDVPFTPLYRVREGVAMNAGFCGAHPKVSYDLSWLADVHVCQQGETE